MASKKRDPDHLLAPEQFPDLNQAFYATKPWTYIDYRNHLLMLAAGAGDQLEKIAEEGISYKGLSYKEIPDDDDETDGEDAREKFVIADSEALLHHASETLLRLYLAHEGLAPCPWLELARVRTPGEFKDLVEDRFLGDLPREERRERVAQVFFGTTDRTKMKPTPSEEDWTKALDNIEAFLIHFAQHWIEAGVYSSLKHGLAVRPGEAKFQLDDGELIKAEGMSIEFLSLRPNSDGRRTWHRSTTWIRPDHSMGLVYMASRLIRSIWSIAKWRYVKERPESMHFWLTPVYEEVTRRLGEGEDAGVFIETMHMELLYYRDPEVEEPPEQAAA